MSKLRLLDFDGSGVDAATGEARLATLVGLDPRWEMRVAAGVQGGAAGLWRGGFGRATVMAQCADHGVEKGLTMIAWGTGVAGDIVIAGRRTDARDKVAVSIASKEAVKDLRVAGR